MRRWLVVVVILATRATAVADDLDPVSVKSHLDGTTAVFDVHYTFHHAGPGIVRDFAELALPEAGVVAGGWISVDNVRHALALGDSQQLDDAFTTLAGAGASGEAGRAVVLQLHDRIASIDLALPRVATLDVELEFTTPTCMFQGTRFAAVPPSWKLGRVDNDVTVGCGNTESSTVWTSFVTTELVAAPDRIGVTGGRLVVGANHVARVEIDLSRSLGATPPDLATAIVIDSSRSLTSRQVDAQREIVLAYLRLVPRSRVQVIATARTATPILPGWMPAASVVPRLDRALRGLSLRNGSNVDAGIAEAERWLALVPGAHRIIVLTDSRLPQRLLDAPPSAHVLTHVVELDDHAVGLTRIDDSPLEALASATTGIAVRGGARDIDATILVRPIALDDVKIAGDGWTALDGATSCAEIIDNGRSCVWWGNGSAVAAPLVIEGLLWNRKVSRIVQLDSRRAKAMARELTVTHPLDEAAMVEVERAAHALTSSWALGTRWGGPGGYEVVEGVSLDSLGTSSVGGGFSVVDPVFVKPMSRGLGLRPQLEREIAKCQVAHHRVVIDIETTRQEIVGVTAVVSPRLIDPESPPLLDALRTCVVEAVWDIELALPDATEHDTHHVALGP